MLKVITSRNNEKVKFAYSLKENSNRKKEKMFLAETFKSLEIAIKNNAVVEVFTLEYLDIPEDIPQNLVSEDVLKKLSSNVNPEGVVFIAKMQECKVSNPNKILYLDEINDPGNMGTLLRTALAFDYDLVVLSDNCVSIYNEKVVNASKGAIFQIPVIKGKLKDYKGTHSILVTNLSEHAIPLDDVKVPGRFVLVLGNEAHGVNKDTRLLADQEIIIPIKNIDSLNVAVAGGILMNKIH